MVLTLTFLIAGIINKDAVYPFETNHVYIWELASIGVASFCLALEPNAERLKGTFLKNILKMSVPAAITSIVGVAVIFGAYHLQKYGVMHTGIYDKDAAVVMCAIVFTVIASAVLFNICRPFSKYRIIVYLISLFLTVSGLAVAALLSYFAHPSFNIFHLNFTAMNPINYFLVGMITLALLTLYLSVTHIVSILRGGDEK